MIKPIAVAALLIAAPVQAQTFYDSVTRDIQIENQQRANRDADRRYDAQTERYNRDQRYQSIETQMQRLYPNSQPQVPTAPSWGSGYQGKPVPGIDY